MSVKHTPTPWYLWEVNGVDFTMISTNPEEIDDETDYNSEVLGSSEWMRVEQADAEFIVLACNYHDELVRKLRTARAFLPQAAISSAVPAYTDTVSELIVEINNLLDKVEGES